MTRIDRLLVERGLADSRNQAQELIEAGRVILVRNGIPFPVKKPSQIVSDPESVEIDVRPPEGQEFVSRGGIKLRGALDRTGLEVANLTVLDVGISTGGFTDCLLQAGAARVIGIDVGHGQLAEKIRRDERVTLIEGVNARDLSSHGLLQYTAGQKFDLIVIDVSFISLRLVLPEIILYLKEQGRILALIKPQFEVGRDGLGKNGIVKDNARIEEARLQIRRVCGDLGLTVEDDFASPIEGSDGNKEYFIVARKVEA
jgi:23S rRNA (cytidine1920-2'-O)/16S rRNA (cytidine1409-2'-O)-methyltransferase